MISKFLTNFDLYQQPFLLIFSNQNKFSLKCGQFLSILILSLMIPCMLYFSKDLYYKSHPKIYEVEEYTENAPEFNFGKNNFFFAIVIRNMSSGKTIHDISKYYQINGVSIGLKENRFVYQPCNFSNFVEQPLFRYDKNYGGEIGFCPEMESFKKVNIGGEQDAKFYFSFSRCNKSLTGTACVTEEEINKFEEEVNLTVLTRSSLFTATNYEHPIQLKLSSITFPLLTNFERNYEAHYVLREILTNEGVVVSSYRKDYKLHRVSSLNVLSKSDFKKNEGINTLTYSFIIKNEKKIIYRDYTKLQDVIALMGGVFHSFYIIGYILTVFYYEISKQNFMLGIFRIMKFRQNNKKKKNKKKKKNINLEKMVVTEEEQKNILKKQNVLIQLNNDLKMHKSFNENIKLNFAKYNEKFRFKDWICKNIIKKVKFKNKDKLKKMLSDQFNSIYDSINISRIVLEFEILKSIIFSKNEKNCLELLSLPVYVIDENYNLLNKNVNSIDFNLDFDFEGYVKQLREKNNSTLTDIEKNLLNMINMKESINHIQTQI